MAATYYPSGGGANTGHEVWGGGADSFSDGAPGIGWADADSSYNPWCRIPSIAIDPGAALLADAFLVMEGGATGSGTATGQTFGYDIYAVDEDDHSAPNSDAAWQTDHGLHTTATVALDLALQDNDSADNGGTDAIFTPNIAALLKEIVDRPGWATGQAMGFHVDADPAGGTAGLVMMEQARLVTIPAGEKWPRPIGETRRINQLVVGNDATIYYPPNMVAGETVILVACDGINQRTWNWPEGWTEIRNLNEGSVSTHVAWHKVTGAEAASFTVTMSGAGSFADMYGMLFRVTNAADPAVTPPECSTGATGTSDAPNPDSLSPSGGSKKYLAVAFAGVDGSSRTVSAYPADYALMQRGYGSGNGNWGCAMHLVESDTLDPGAFTFSASDGWAAVTVCVYPGPDIPAADPVHGRGPMFRAGPASLNLRGIR